jgi:hypothetical protein
MKLYLSGIAQLAENWIAEWERRDSGNKKVGPSDAIDKVMELHLDDEHDLLWNFILEAYPKEMSSRVFAVLAAGPLEDLLANFGSEYIDRVETLARQDPRFNELLGGVWRNSITEEVWERITGIRTKIW